MRGRFTLGLFLVWLAATGTAAAASPASAPESLTVLTDPSAALTLNEVRAAPEERFVPITGSRAFGFTTAAFWARFRLPPELSVLEIDYRGLDEVTLYVPTDAGYDAHASGDLLPFSARQIPHRLEAFYLPAATSPAASWAYLRVASSGPVVFPLKIRNPEAFHAHVHEERMALGMYYGAMLVMVLYNLLLFVAFRNVHYCLFAMFTGAFAASQFIENGLAFEIVWPGSPWLENVSLPIMMALAVFWAVAFSMGFLQARSGAPRLYRAGRVFLGVIALVALAPVAVPYRFALPAVLVVWALGVVYALALTAAALRKRRRDAFFYIAAWGGLLLGSLLNVLAHVSVIPHTFFTYYAPQMGALVLVAVLSAGLADRIVALRRRRDAALRDAHLDALTGLANRRRFDEYLNVEWQRAQRDHTSLALVLLDLDFFHQYNERFGHLQGDECLKRIAQALSCVPQRPADLVARYGGEEFAVILPGTDLPGALHIAEALRASVEALGLAHPASGEGAVVTASVGVACEMPAPERGPAALVLAADEALYEAKRGGRNRVVEAARPQYA